jgi:hypothetical protein
MAAPSTLKEAHSDSSPGKFLNTDEWVFTCLSSPGIVKVRRLCCHLIEFCYFGVFSMKKAHIFIQTQCGIKYFTGFEVVT